VTFVCDYPMQRNGISKKKLRKFRNFMTRTVEE